MSSAFRHTPRHPCTTCQSHTACHSRENGNFLNFKLKPQTKSYNLDPAMGQNGEKEPKGNLKEGDKKPFAKKITGQVMDFLFGKKFPIFNKEGKIEHSRKNAMESWKKRYENDEDADWRNHSGMTFKNPR